MPPCRLPVTFLPKSLLYKGSLNGAVYVLRCNVNSTPHSRTLSNAGGRGILKGVRPEDPLNAVGKGSPGEGESEPLPLGGLFSILFSSVREKYAAGGSTYQKSIELLYEKCKCKTTEHPISIDMFLGRIAPQAYFSDARKVTKRPPKGEGFRFPSPFGNPRPPTLEGIRE